jgi:4-amino-4-deoxy-L-arabinose transferase-like glycosyltransferase
MQRAGLEALVRVLCWALIVWVTVLSRLGYPSLLDPDEAHYAQITREMLETGNWLVPTFDGKAYIDKPVFFHWIQGLSMTLFGQNELAARLPSALAALLLMAIVWRLGTRLFDRQTGERAAAMFATVPLTFALAGIGQLDMLYAAFLFGGVACLIVSALDGRLRLQYGGYLLVAAATIVKGPVALLLVALFFGAAALCGPRTREPILRLHWVRGLMLVVVAASPWFLWMASQLGEEFTQQYFIAGNLWYFTNPAEFSTRRMPHTFYLRIFLAAFFPWSLLVVGRLIDVARTWRGRPVPTGELLLWLWTLVVIAFFSAARFKLDHYIFPIAPACCLVAARAWPDLAAAARARWTRISGIAIAGSFLLLGAICSVVLFQLNLGLGLTALGLPAALMIGGAALIRQLTRRRWAPEVGFGVALATLLAVYGSVVLVGLPVLERSRPTAPLARWIAQNTSTETPVGIYRTHDWRASVRYYAGRPVTPLENTEELRRFLEPSPDAHVVMIDRDYEAVRREGVDLECVIERPAIVGRTGKYFRRQVWGKLVVARRRKEA